MAGGREAQEAQEAARSSKKHQEAVSSILNYGKPPIYSSHSIIHNSDRVACAGRQVTTAETTVSIGYEPCLAGASHKPQDPPHGIVGNNVSPEVWEVDETIARGPSEDAADDMTDDVSLAAPASSPVESGVAMPMDNITDATVNVTETPPSTPLEGECDAQRCTNGTRTSHQHGMNAHGEGPSAWAERHASCTTNTGPRVPDGIIDDPGERTEPGTSGSPLSILLEGEQPSSGHADDGPAARMCRVQAEDQQTDRLCSDIPELSALHAKCPKRPTEHVNPPCRRGRLKVQSGNRTDEALKSILGQHPLFTDEELHSFQTPYRLRGSVGIGDFTR
ncbi:hypothetical protein BU15DRAFT_68909, partial [Melanogaster broomeanus]